MELSDLGLQPQAQTHGPDMASMMVIHSPRGAVCSVQEGETHKESRCTENTTGCRHEYRILTARFAVLVSIGLWQLYVSQMGAICGEGDAAGQPAE